MSEVREEKTFLPYREIYASIITLLLTAIITIMVMLGIRIDLIRAFSTFADAVFGWPSFSENLVKASPLILTGLGAAIGAKARFFNIGLEGQFCMGAIATAITGIVLGNIGSISLTVMFIASFLAGAGWALIPGLLKVKLNVNDIISTAMMNYIALFLVSYLVRGPLKDPTSALYQSQVLPITARLPKLIEGTRLHAGFVASVIVAIFTYVLLYKTTFGYSLRVCGSNPLAARTAGMKTAMATLFAAGFSGGLAGIAGMIEVAGIQWFLSDFASMVIGTAGYGYFGWPVALVGNLHPIGIIFSAILFGALLYGGEAMKRGAGVPYTVVIIIQGIVIFSFMISNIFISLRKTFYSRGKKEEG